MPARGRRSKTQRLVEEAQAGPFRLRIPQFDEVVTIIPERSRTSRDQRERREARIKRMVASPLPDGVRDVQDFLAAYDDIQDSFVTLAVAARLAVRFYPPAERTARVLATVTDVLNLGPAGIALASLRSPRKPHLAAKYSSVPNTYRLRLQDTVRSGKWGPRFTEFLQVAQTSSSIFGVGLTLGAIMALPPTAASLAVTGGQLELNPFPFDESLMREYLGPWERSARLRSNPPLRAQVDAAKANALDDRRQRINAILRQDTITGQDRRLLNLLLAKGDTLEPAELAAALDKQGTIEMPKLFGLPMLAEHIIGPVPGVPIPDVLRDRRILTTADLAARGIPVGPPRGPLTPEATRAFVQGLYMETRQLIQSATMTLNAWKKIFKSHQSLTAEEHLETLAALHLAWQIIGPWFGAFGYDLAGDLPQKAIDDVPQILDALTLWTDELPTSEHREVAQQLVADIPRLIYRGLTDIRTPPVESLTPLAGFSLLMTELGGVAKLGSSLGGSTIDRDRLAAMVSRDLWQDLTDGERRAVLELFAPGPPTALPP